MKNNKRRRSYEEKTKKKEEDLRGELRKLRKEVLQLRKENARLRGRDDTLQDLIEEFEEHAREVEVIETKPQCPKCGSYNVRISEKLRGDTDYYFCENPGCGARGPKNGKNK